MPMSDILALQVALVNFATKVYPTRLDYVDLVLGFAIEVLKKATTPKLEKGCVKQVVELLTLPLETLSLQILNLTSYGPLCAFLDPPERKTVALTIVQAVNKSRSPLDTVAKVDTLFRYLAPIIKDEPDSKRVPDDDRFEFEQEQHQMARMFHLIGHDDTDEHFKLYATARKYFGTGGPQRIEYTLPPMVFGSLALARRVFAREEKADTGLLVKTKKLFGFVHETISVLTPQYPELALRLFVQAAQAANQCQLPPYEAIAYEFFAQAFIAYEDEISDSKQQYVAVTYITSALQGCTIFGKENYDTLISKATQHSAKLLKKPDQCRAVYTAAHLFWPHTDSPHRDEKRVLACLQRALKIANGCMGSQVHLFVEILNKYLYFFDRACPSITVKYLKGLIALIDEHIPNLDTSESSQGVKIHYQNTIAHIKLKQSLDDELGRRYQTIDSSSEASAPDLSTGET